MLSVEEALERILSYFQILETERKPLLDAQGQVLAEDLIAGFDIPSLANSAMDGFAVRSADVGGASLDSPVELTVTGKVAAGELPDRPVDPDTAIRIMTGAPIPDGADAVVAFEDTDELERSDRSAIGIRLDARVGENVRPPGEDVRSGEVVLAKGATLGPAEIGVAASLGLGEVSVVRRPVVSIVATGDELLEPGQQHRPGFVYNSNTFSIAAGVNKYGGITRIIGIARDTIESLNIALNEALDGADMVITSAGVSKGDYDVVKDVLDQRGEIALWSVRMRPAKPLAFGALTTGDGRKVPHLGLPGNPVSTMVAFEQFARPAIRLMLGMQVLDKPEIRATLDDAIENYDGRRVYARVIVYRDEDGQYRAKSTGSQNSNVLTSMARANGLAICPDNVARKEPGEVVAVQMLDWPDEYI
ncbi:MAG: molybdopterin molybdotransferase MoeA [Chloroflexi bacterium]|nr:molybdopterin molybdotransferase MoeA [Chloroflexota bacterium]